jgi:hypothetical protein
MKLTIGKRVLFGFGASVAITVGLGLLAFRHWTTAPTVWWSIACPGSMSAAGWKRLPFRITRCCLNILKPTRRKQKLRCLTR